MWAITYLSASRQPAPTIEPVPEVLPLSVSGNGIPSQDRAYLAVRLLWEQRRLIAAVVLRGTLLFLIIAWLIPSSYESKTELMPPDSQSSTLGKLATLSSGTNGALSAAADLLDLKTSGALFISLLNSDRVSDHLIDRFDLRGVYWVKTYRAARKKLASRTQISEDRKSGVLTIVISDHDRQRAAALARAYVDELNSMVTELNTSAAHRERIFLEGRLQVVKQELDRASREFSDFSSQNTAIDIKEQGKAMVEAAATLQGQLIAAQSELRGLEQIYTSQNVRVRSAQARIRELQHQLDKLGGDSPQPAGGQPASPALYPSIRQLPILGVTYSDLYRRVKINETVYEVLTKEYELARVEEAKEVPSVKVIDVAQPPERRSGPPRLLITVAGALLSALLAAVWIFGKEAWTNTDAEDPRKVLLGDMAATLGRKLRWHRAREISFPQILWPGFHRNRNGSDR